MDLLAAYSSGSDDDGEEDLDAHESACFSEHIKEPSGASGREGSAFTLNREPLQAKVITASTANQVSDCGASSVLDPLSLPHQGRKRSFILADGEYPLVVCIPVPLDPAAESRCSNIFTQLQQLIPDLQPMTESFQDTQRTRLRMQQQDQTLRHVSLSRTVPLRFHNTESLLMELKRELRTTKSGAVVLSGLQCFVNDEKTRSFLSVPVTAGKPQVLQIIHHVDSAFSSHGLPSFHKDAQPHMSFGWVLGDQRAALEEAILRVTQSAAFQLEIPLDRIICRIGLREHCVWKKAAR